VHILGLAAVWGLPALVAFIALRLSERVRAAAWFGIGLGLTIGAFFLFQTAAIVFLPAPVLLIIAGVPGLRDGSSGTSLLATLAVLAAPASILLAFFAFPETAACVRTASAGSCTSDVVTGVELLASAAPWAVVVVAIQALVRRNA
jgi:hypothetical protein